MKFFVCLLEKYWVGSKVLVLFSFKIICHLCHCWIYCVIYLWLTIIQGVYASLHCITIIYQICRKGNIKREKVVSVAIPCPPTLGCKKNLMCASANLFFLPRAGRGCWHLNVTQGYTQGPSGLYQWRGCMAGRLLEVWRCSRTLPKVAWKSWRQYGN